MNTTSYIVGGIFLVLVIYVINTNWAIRNLRRKGGACWALWNYDILRRISGSYVYEVWPTEGQDVQTFKDWWAFRVAVGVVVGLSSFAALVLFLEHESYLCSLVITAKSFTLSVISLFAFLAVIPCLIALIGMSIRSVVWGLAALRYDPERKRTLS